MCQMCDEYENELVRMGLIEDAKKFRAEREAAHDKTAEKAESGKPGKPRAS